MKWVPEGELAYNITFIDEFLNPRKSGVEMGCGCTPLSDRDCLHIDISPQPKAVEIVGDKNFFQFDASLLSYNSFGLKFDWIFSSHMVEDLETTEKIIECLNNWASLLKSGGYLVLLLPDMQGGRYPTVSEGGNPSHKVDVGVDFILSIEEKLPCLSLVQIDTIPHDKSCTFDVVFQRV